MKKTVAQLKRDAKSMEFEGKMVVRCGEKANDSNLPSRLKGWRAIIGANTKNIFFRDGDGKRSFLDIPKASLVEYTDGMLRIYYPGYREPNETEKRILNEWKEIANTDDYQNRLKTDLLTDGSSTFYQQKRFFKDRNAEYLLGFETQRGMKLDFNKKANGDPRFICDEKIKGDIYMEYEIRKIEK